MLDIINKKMIYSKIELKFDNLKIYLTNLNKNGKKNSLTNFGEINE